MEYCKAKKEDTNDLKKIFKICFGESEENTEKYFKYFIDYKIGYVAKENGQVCASLYLIASNICIDGKEYKSHYLYGAGTLPEYRKKGIMEELIKYSHKKAAKEGDIFSSLVPANKKLYNYYSKFDYETVYKCKTVKISYQEIEKIESKYLKEQENNTKFDNMSKLRFNIISRLNGSMNFDKNYLYGADKIYRIYGGGLLTFDIGYVAYYREKEEIYIQDIICKEKDLKVLIKSFAKVREAKDYILRTPINFSISMIKEEKVSDVGMVKVLDKNLNIDINRSFNNSYLGLTLD